jgi:hypothetical protein
MGANPMSVQRPPAPLAFTLVVLLFGAVDAQARAVALRQQRLVFALTFPGDTLVREAPSHPSRTHDGGCVRSRGAVLVLASAVSASGETRSRSSARCS